MQLKSVNYSCLKGISMKIQRFNHSWVQPEGFDTGIKVFNCTTKSKVPFIVKNKNLIKWYTCGPTVYDSSHIGHASCYTKLDIIQSILKNHFHMNLVTVMNITDIDDKIIKKSIETNKIYSEIAQIYEKEFWVDLGLLGIQKPDVVLRVSENILLIIEFIEQLMKTQMAYQSGDNSIYLDVLKLNNYGKLQNIGQNQDVKNSHKKNDADFALWKSCKPNEPHWNSPWGPGRPGWHIECSTLATQAFDNNIDIHAGGIDLRFPHHENEEAQSCAFHNTNQWVNYWMHTGHLHLRNSEKMSKSLKNTVSIKNMLKSVKPEAFRMACSMSHYRSPMEYNQDFMELAQNVLNSYKRFIVNCEEYSNGILKGSINTDVLLKLLQDSNAGIHQSFCNDFDTPNVINILNKIVSEVNAMLHTTPVSNKKSEICVIALHNLVIKTLSVLQIHFVDNKVINDDYFINIMNVLNSFRQDVRTLAIDTKRKDLLHLCDVVRQQLSLNGVTVKDHGKISSWSK